MTTFNDNRDRAIFDRETCIKQMKTSFLAAEQEYA